jgi:hypothetical protein
MGAGRTGRVHGFDAWTAEEHGPQPWLVDMGGRRDTEVGWYLDGLRAFLAAASSDVSEASGAMAGNGRCWPCRWSEGLQRGQGDCLLGLLGLRVSEACSINIEHISTERGHPTVKVLGKGSKLAVIPLPHGSPARWRPVPGVNRRRA